MPEIYPLSSDQVSQGKILYIGWVALLVFAMFFFTINVPDQAAKAAIYISLGTFSLIIIGLDIALKKSGRVELPDTTLYEEPLIDIPKPLLVGLLFVAFIGTFILISGGQYAITSPAFDALKLGDLGNAVLVISAAVMENIFFFGIIGPMLAAFVFVLLGNKGLSLASFFVLTPLIFMTFHIAVYGFSNISASLSTLIFGIEQVVMIFLFRNLIWSDIRHISNNLGIVLLQNVSFSTLIFSLFTNIWFLGIIGIASIAAIQKARGKF